MFVNYISARLRKKEKDKYINETLMNVFYVK